MDEIMPLSAPQPENASMDSIRWSFDGHGEWQVNEEEGGHTGASLLSKNIKCLSGVILWAAAGLCFPQSTPEANPDHLLATNRPGSRSESLLTLYQRQLPLPSQTARVRYWLVTKPPVGADSDLVFYLVHQGATQGQIVFITYASSHFNPVFSASIVTSPPRVNLAQVVLAKQFDSTTLTFSIYEADTTKKIGTLPLQLDPEHKEVWPQPSKPVSELTHENPKAQALTGCAVTSIEGSSKDENITVLAHREPRSCGSLKVTFDRKSSQWSEVTEQPESKH